CALDHFVSTAARDESGAIFLERRLVGGEIVLVALGILDRDMHHPIALWHGSDSLDDDDVGFAGAFALGFGGLIFGRIVAGDRIVIGGKLAHHVARNAATLH